MTEAELLASVRELCGWLHLAVYHTHDSRRSDPGFPDLVIVGKAVLWRELKADHGRMTLHQHHWRELLQSAGQDWAVWRPADWMSGAIEQQLRALSARAGARPAS
jgi:hypothetical protein